MWILKTCCLLTQVNYSTKAFFCMCMYVLAGLGWGKGVGVVGRGS